MIKIETLVSDAYPIELADLAKKFDGATVFYAQSNKELWKIASNLPFFSDIKIILYPEWDCDFYDNNSPSRHILNSRINGLYEIMQNKEQAIIITTPKAVTPLTIPCEILNRSAFLLKCGQTTDINVLSEMLTEIGFIRVNNALNYGDYAIRGDIIDIANIDNEIGHRIDIFGDTVEKIKYFSLQSQISTGKTCDQINILPTDEVIMNNKTIETFKLKTKGIENANYSSIIDGVKIMSYVHYLPFFYENPANFFDYFKTKYQIITSTPSQAIIPQIFNEIEINYARTLNNSYNKYQYPQPKQSFVVNG